jgi:N-formylglutamate amidohydrolase
MSVFDVISGDGPINLAQPHGGIHAIQTELAQRVYLTEKAPWAYREERADILHPLLSQLMNKLDQRAQSGVLKP